MMIKFVPMLPLSIPAKQILRPREEKMSPFNNRKDRNTEEREEGPEKGDNDPSCEEFLRENVRSAV